MGGGIYPEEWELSTVEFIAKFIDYRGRTPIKTPNGIPLITAKNIRDGYINREPREYISESDYDDWMTRGIPKSGDVVITTEAPMGNVALVDISERFALAQRAICLQCYKPEVGRFLHYALRSPTFQKDLTMNATGTTVSGIKAATLKSLSIPIPSSAEQKEIADRLDTLLAQVEATQARLAHIPYIIKCFRQSVLASAVRGRLTLNMDVEFERLTINSVCNAAFDGPFGSKLKSSDYTSDGVRVIRLENIGHLEFFSEKKTYISKEKYSELKKNEILKNDVLFSSFVDQEVRTCLFDDDDIYINKADCFCLRPNQNKINPKYLSFLLASRTSYEQIKEKVQGVTRPRINLKKLKSLEFMIPSIAAQNEIVSQVEKLFAYADTIEQQTKAAKERVDNLTQAILAKAFRGELTADWRAANPDLISGDHSAAALLARIQAERATVKPRKRATKKSAT